METWDSSLPDLGHYGIKSDQQGKPSRDPPGVLRVTLIYPDVPGEGGSNLRLGDSGGPKVVSPPPPWHGAGRAG